MSKARLLCCLLVLVSVFVCAGCKDDGDTFIIIPDNLPPEVSAIPDQNATEGSPFSLDLSIYIVDDKDTLADLTFAVVTGGGAFTAAVYNNTFTSTGSLTVKFLVTDTDGMSTVSSFNVTVAPMSNSAPVVAAIPGQIGTMGYTFILDVAGYVSDDHDADADLAFAITSGGGDFLGTVYANTFATTGLQAVQFSVTDSGSLSATGQFNVDVQEPDPANTPPVINAIPTQNATELTPFGLDLTPYVTDDRDLIGDLTFGVIEGGGSFAGPVYSNTFDSTGLLTVRFVVIDTWGASAPGTFDVDVAEMPNSAPVVSAIPDQNAVLNQTFVLDLAGYVSDDLDPDEDLAFTVTSAEGSFSGTVFINTFTSVATHVVDFDVEDTRGATSNGTFNVIIELAPVADFTVDAQVATTSGVFQFIDLSTGTVDYWAWDFDNDGTVDSTLQDPQWTYSALGTYTVRLTVGGPGGTDTELKLDLIQVVEGIFVDDAAGLDSNNGFTWATAVKSIGKGLEIAISAVMPITVTVADGTYTGALNRDLDFTGKDIYLKSLNGPASCTIDCGGAGRAFYFHSGETSNAIVEGFTITNGSATIGGGIYCDSASSPILRNLVIQNCLANGGAWLDGGGGIACYNNSSPTIEHCVLRDCQALMGAGGIQVAYGGSNPQIVNCVIANNFGSLGGGISLYWECAATLVNCTLANNFADWGGGAFIYTDIMGTGTTLTMNNTVIWGNAVNNQGAQALIVDPTDTLTLDYCCYANGANDIVNWGGTFTPTNCITSDPLFGVPGSPGPGGGGDFHLKPDSPCVDTGEDTYATWSEDLDGQSRILGSSVDRGADELNTIHVQTDYLTISAALAAATDWDFILVQDGTYNENDLDFAGKTVTLRSEYGSASTIIDCGGVGRAFIFQSGETANSELDSFTIINGNATWGGGILVTGSSPILKNLIIQDCVATTMNWPYGGGGGIWVGDDSAPVISHCIIRGNQGRQGGGIFLPNSASPLQTKIINCLITNNEVVPSAGQGWGGGICCYNSETIITNCTIANNLAGANGGGVELEGAPTVTLNNTLVWGNASNNTEGHQIYIFGGGTMTLDYCCYTNGTDDVEGVAPTVTNSFTSNPGYLVAGTPGLAGGGDFHLKPGTLCFNRGSNTYATWSNDLDGNVRIRSVSVDIGVYEQGYINVPNDYGTIGAAIAAATDLDLILVEDGTYNETGLDFGGLEIAVRSENGPAGCIIDCQSAGRAFIFQSGETNDSVLEGFTIQNGSITNGNGGGILCAGGSSPVLRELVITVCNVTGTDFYTAGNGAAIHCADASNPLITGCEIVNNTSDYFGAGIAAVNAYPTISNCLLANNLTPANGGGGGISIYNPDTPGPVTITNCTVADNVAVGGGGFIFMGCNAVINNTISWGNVAMVGGNEIYIMDTSVITLNYCDIPSPAQDPNRYWLLAGGSVDETNTFLNANPAFIGGGNYRLDDTVPSPCINAGSNIYAINAGLDWDLDGNTRIVNGVVDIGAYEDQP